LHALDDDTAATLAVPGRRQAKSRPNGILRRIKFADKGAILSGWETPEAHRQGRAEDRERRPLVGENRLSWGADEQKEKDGKHKLLKQGRTDFAYCNDDAVLVAYRHYAWKAVFCEIYLRRRGLSTGLRLGNL
jgi:hypothetical protein